MSRRRGHHLLLYPTPAVLPITANLDQLTPPPSATIPKERPPPTPRANVWPPYPLTPFPITPISATAGLGWDETTQELTPRQGLASQLNSTATIVGTVSHRVKRSHSHSDRYGDTGCTSESEFCSRYQSPEMSRRGGYEECSGIQDEDSDSGYRADDEDSESD